MMYLEDDEAIAFVPCVSIFFFLDLDVFAPPAAHWFIYRE
jgi:hypothetical protein